MKRRSWRPLAFGVALSVAAALARPAAVHQPPRIPPGEQTTVRGGIAAKPNQFPHVASVTAGPEPCTGVLVGPRTILTADHCLTGSSAISVTSPDWDNPLNAVECRLLPALELGILKLEDTGPSFKSGPSFFAEIPSTPQNLKKNQVVLIVGYGPTKDGGGSRARAASGRPRITTTPSPSSKSFEVDGSQTGCPGDSGGPAFIDVDQGRELVGIFLGSPTEDTAGSCQSGVYVRVDQPRVRKWIRAAVEQANASAPTRGSGEVTCRIEQ